MSKSGQAFQESQEDALSHGELILKSDAPLHIDVSCYSCRRRVALSNTVEIDGRRYCNKCN